MNTLTQKQEKILEYIKQVKKEKGYPPAVREICDAVGLKSTSTVHSHLRKLEEKGYIRRDPTKPRAIEIIDATKDWIEDHVTLSPVLGKVTAGEPIFAEQNIDTYLPLPNNLVRNKDSYVLKVSGESMINAGILDGDLIIVNSQQTATNGDIVVAMLEGEVTVKRFFKENGYIRLQPENDYMEPICGINIEVIGKVIGLYREM